MNRRPLIQAFGSFSPAGESICAALEECSPAIGGEDEGPWWHWEKECLGITFSGRCFPHEELLAVLRQDLPPTAQGRLDFFFLDAWKVERHRFFAGNWSCLALPLNDLLARSGF